MNRYDTTENYKSLVHSQVETSDHFEAGESSQLRQLAKRIQQIPRKQYNKDK